MLNSGAFQDQCILLLHLSLIMRDIGGAAPIYSGIVKCSAAIQHG